MKDYKNQPLKRYLFKEVKTVIDKKIIILPVSKNFYRETVSAKAG